MYIYIYIYIYLVISEIASWCHNIIHAILQQNKILGVHQAGVGIPLAWSMHRMHPGIYLYTV